MTADGRTRADPAPEPRRTSRPSTALVEERIRPGRRSWSSSCASRPRAATWTELRAAAELDRRPPPPAGATVDVVEATVSRRWSSASSGTARGPINAVHTTTSSRPRRSSCGPRRRTSRRSATDASRARGATDNKGELLPRIWALEAYRDAIGPLPCRVRFLVEGQEETAARASTRSWTSARTARGGRAR